MTMLNMIIEMGQQTCVKKALSEMRKQKIFIGSNWKITLSL